MGWWDGKKGDGSAWVIVRDPGLCVWERSEVIIKEQRQNFKGIWSSKLQGNVQKSFMDVPALVTHTQPELWGAAHTICCRHTPEGFNNSHRISRTFTCWAQTRVCSHAWHVYTHVCVFASKAAWFCIILTPEPTTAPKNSAKAGSPLPAQETLCRGSSWAVFWSLKNTSEGF